MANGSRVVSSMILYLAFYVVWMGCPKEPDTWQHMYHLILILLYVTGMGEMFSRVEGGTCQAGPANSHKMWDEVEISSWG